MPRAGPRKVHRYSLEFTLKAVKLSQLKGVDADDDAVPSPEASACAAPRGARPTKNTHPVHLRTKADVFAFID